MKVKTLSLYKASLYSVMTIALLSGLFALSAHRCEAAVSMQTGLSTNLHGDLPQIIQRQSLRVLVAFDNVGFFMNKGQQDGLYVALMDKYKQFLQKTYPEANNLKIYFIPVPQDQMEQLVSAGYGDIAFGLTQTDELKRYIDFTIPEKQWLKEIAVTRAGSPPIKTIEDFAGRYFWVREKSSYYESLKSLNVYLRAMRLKPVMIIKAEEYLTDSDLIDMVAKGEILNTIVEDSRLTVYQRYFNNVVFNTSVPLKANSSLSWGIRRGSREFFRSLNKFLLLYRDGTSLGTPIYDRYLRTVPTYASRNDRTNNEWLGIKAEDFVKYARVFKKYGAQYNLDWMLLMAQGYQESTLNPNAKSNRGAVGIMQVLPSTANERYINVHNVNDIDNNVNAGTKYMRYILDHYFQDQLISDDEKLLFALASYNCGPNRIREYQREAKTRGLNHYLWFDNVEKIAMEKGAFETVKYVRNISSLYISYKNTYALQQKKQAVRSSPLASSNSTQVVHHSTPVQHHSTPHKTVQKSVPVKHHTFKAQGQKHPKVKSLKKTPTKSKSRNKGKHNKRK